MHRSSHGSHKTWVYPDLTTNRIWRVWRVLNIFPRKQSQSHDFRPKLGTTTIQLSQSARITEYQQCRLWIHLWITFLSMKMTTSIRHSTISREFGRQTINRARSQELWIPQYKTSLWNNNRVSGASGSPDSCQEHQDLSISGQKQDLEISGSVGAKQNKQVIKDKWATNYGYWLQLQLLLVLCYC